MLEIYSFKIYKCIETTGSRGKVGRPNNANVIRSKYIKKPKEDSQNRLISPLSKEDRHKF
jgi:hypothetical protein